MEKASWLNGSLDTLTAAVVGVIANLTVWFALHVFFNRIDERQLGPLRLYAPDTTSFSWQAALLAIIAALIIFRLKWNVIAVLAVAGLSGIGLSFIT